jgi:hypothetical protein
MLVEFAQEKAKSAEGEIKLDFQAGKTTDELSVHITKVVQSIPLLKNSISNYAALSVIY